MKCPHCKNNVAGTVEPGVGQHYAALRCNHCGKHSWIPKPDTDRIRRPSPHRELVKKYGRDFCELCLKPADGLPSRQSLEAHHVLELQGGGSNDRSNIWIVCTSCHKLIHHQRHWR